MRIVHVCRTAPPVLGGLEHVVGELSVRQARRGHEVVVASFVDGGGAEAPERAIERVRLRRVGPRRWPFALGLRAAVRGADLVHVHAIDGLLDQVLALADAPVGVSTHGGYFHTARHPLLKALWLRTGTAASLRRADAVWYTSEADRERFAPAGVAGTVETPGIDLARFRGVVRRPVAGRIVVPGRIAAHKGQGDALGALAVLAAERPIEVRFLGPEAEPGAVARLRWRAELLGVDRVLRFPGGLGPDAYAAELAEAELALFPSRAEGFGIAAVEAIAAGVPSVLSDIPAHRAHAGVVPIAAFDDPWAVVAAVRRAEPPDRKYADQFGWDTRVEAFEARYRELVRGAR